VLLAFAPGSTGKAIDRWAQVAGFAIVVIPLKELHQLRGQARWIVEPRCALGVPEDDAVPRHHQVLLTVVRPSSPYSTIL